MAEENKDVQIDVNTSGEAGAEQAPQYTEIEQKALDMGWRPRDDFEGTDDDFIDAKEYVRRKPLFDKIEHTSKELRSMRKALNALQQHYTAVEKAAVTKALDTLKQQRKEAISEGDGDKFDSVDSEIKRVEQQVGEIEAAAGKDVVEEIQQVHPQFAAWQAKNPWYDSVGYMRKFADEVGGKLHLQGMSPPEVLKEVEKAVRKEFPQKFTNPNKASAPDVESGKPSGRSSARAGDVEMTDLERRIMNTLVNSKQITKEKYLADLKAIKGIK
jgi:hypothetical protein